VETYPFIETGALTRELFGQNISPTIALGCCNFFF